MTVESKRKEVQNWWAENPMTYGAVHGDTSYEDGEFELGTIPFFNRVDKEFYSWNTPLHNERPFGRLFPYDRYNEESKVLEVGCGLGTMAMNWARQGVRMTAVDLNPTSVDQTRKRFELHNLKGDVFLSDARHLDFPDETFDYAYSWGVLHHSPNLSDSVAELMRTLKSGGGFGIMLYNRDSILYRYDVEYMEGFLHYEKRFLGPLELASRYGDGAEQEGNPHTLPVTKAEVRELMAEHSSDMAIKCLGTDLDPIFARMLPFIGRVTPKRIKKAWARRYGWSLWICGTKR